LIAAAPERMVWASNWPHPSFKKEFPDEGRLLDLVADWTQDEALRRKILVANPAKLCGFYGFAGRRMLARSVPTIVFPVNPPASTTFL
jgi:hypothetical protein